jgi:CDP-diacylglycerol--inositol 3-phosphatidyltransferase
MYSKRVKKREWLYIPNLIGYARLYLLLLFVLSANPLYQALWMTLSLGLDVLDGYLARKLDQCTLFGARLDLMIDMLSLVLLASYAALSFPPGWVRTLCLLCALNDLVGYSCSLLAFYRGNRSSNHKEQLKAQGYLLPFYYSRSGLALSNVLHDAFFLLQIYMPPLIPSIVIYLCLAGCLFRQMSVAEQTCRLWHNKSCR